MAVAALVFAVITIAPGTADANDRSLKLYNTHTKERATIVYKRGRNYDRAGLAKVNHFLRDWRRDEPTKMDPKLLDLVWEIYRQTGSKKSIHVISGYRSPETNGVLRKRSKGVAKHSQHMRGKALDFYIPGVPLSKLRAIGLRAHVGGVGFYPRSGSPFVHVDTGSVRHWPRMSRQQLARVFPKGKTLHVPSDGKPLPGYAVALAKSKIRSRSGKIEIASSGVDTAPPPSKSRKAVGAPVVIASVSEDFDNDRFIPPPPPIRPEAGNAAIPPPRPRPSPIPAYSPPVVVATAEPLTSALQPWTASSVISSIGGSEAIPREFASDRDWNSPPVPVVLARAMAARDVSRPASLPIHPTSIVETIDVSRPLRAEAITSAVLTNDGGTIRDVTPFFAYAESISVITPVETGKTVVSTFGVPIPVANPMRVSSAPPASLDIPETVRARPQGRLPTEELTLTALDTLAFKLWIGDQSIRRRQYSVLTMPDFSQIRSLFEKPEIVYRAGFGNHAYQGLRTDHFSGPLVKQPAVIDLSNSARLAFR